MKITFQHWLQPYYPPRGEPVFQPACRRPRTGWTPEFANWPGSPNPAISTCPECRLLIAGAPKRFIRNAPAEVVALEPDHATHVRQVLRAGGFPVLRAAMRAAA